MDKQSIILAAFSTANDRNFSPVQIQKLLFLIDKNVGEKIGGPFFNFQPYDYGPFDSEIYTVLNQLISDGLLEQIETSRGWKLYKLTQTGLEKGQLELTNLEQKFQTYFEELASFIHSLSFSQLVSTIYKAYPEMKVNSVFREL